MFEEYAKKVFIPHLQLQLYYSKHVDLVWDTYIPDSLKDTTRKKTGQGVRRKLHFTSLLSPTEISWVKGESDQWQPDWITIPKVSTLCRELIKCN